MREISIIGKLPGGSKPSLRQLEVMKKIITYGIDKGFLDTEIATVLKIAWIESSLGANMGPPRPTNDNPCPTASGLFAYTDNHWKNYHKDTGDKNDDDSQIKAIYKDLKRFKERYDDVSNKQIPRDEISFEEYFYIKHHDGTNYSKFKSAPGLEIWIHIIFKIEFLEKEVIKLGSMPSRLAPHEQYASGRIKDRWADVQQSESDSIRHRWLV